MNAQLRRRLEMAERVREFLRAHKTDGVGEGLGLAKLEALLQRAEVLAAQQRAGLVAKRWATTRRKELRGTLHRKLLLYLRAVGAVAAKENAELAVEFQMPPSNASSERPQSRKENCNALPRRSLEPAKRHFRLY